MARYDSLPRKKEPSKKLHLDSDGKVIGLSRKRKQKRVIFKKKGSGLGFGARMKRIVDGIKKWFSLGSKKIQKSKRERGWGDRGKEKDGGKRKAKDKNDRDGKREKTKKKKVGGKGLGIHTRKMGDRR